MLLALAAPASAGVYNPIPADASGDLQDTFVDDDALFAYATVDIQGGEICIINNVDEMEGQSCERPAWGTSNTIVGIGTTYTLLEAPTLYPGTWRLLAVNSVGEPTALSIPFTVSPCQDCSRAIADSVVAEWKARAGQARVGAQVMCTAWAIQAAAEIPGKMTAAHGKITKLRQRADDWQFNNAGFFATVVPTLGGLITFPSASSAITAGEMKAKEILKNLICTVDAMYEDIVNDPPDPEFDELAAPVFSSIGPLGSEQSNALAASIDRQAAFGGASLHAFERYLGATEADSEAGVHRQARSLASLNGSLVQELRDSAAALRDYAQMLDGIPEFDDPVISDEDTRDVLVSVYERVQAGGFTAEETEELTDQGFSAAQIADIRTHFDLDPADVPVDTSLAEIARTTAQTFEDQVGGFDAMTREAAAIAGRSNTPPEAGFTATPDEGPAPLTVTFQDTSTSPDSDPLTVGTWDFGDGESRAATPGESITHTYTAPGVYTATLTMSDGVSEDSATRTITVGRGTLVIEKQVVPDGDTARFDFTAPSLESFQLGDGETRTVDVDAGTHVVTEAVVDGYELQSLSCDDGGSALASSTSVEDRRATARVESGETVTCVFTNRRRVGMLVVEKQVVPDGDAGRFDFTAEGISFFQLGDGERQTIEVPAGSHVVTEAPVDGYELSSLSCDDEGSAEPSTTSVEDRRATVRVETDETVTCVFTNRKRVGTLVIEKQVVPDGDPARFDFTAQGISFFGLGDGDRYETEVAPGTYEVTEAATDGFDLSSLNCDDGASAQPSTTSLGDRRATVELETGETVTCVFTSRKRGRVVVRKEVSPGSPTQGPFGFTGAVPFGAFELSAGAERSESVAAGEYQVAEDTPPEGMLLSRLTCDDGTSAQPSTVDIPARRATFEVEPGETVTCTWLNGPPDSGEIVIASETEPAGGTDFSYIVGSLPAFTLSDGQERRIPVGPGDHGVFTSAPAGWRLRASGCDDGASVHPSVITLSSGTVSVEPGEVVRCTFTYARLGTVILEKRTEPPGAPASFAFETPDSITHHIPDGETRSLDLLPGARTITEQAADGWELAAIECDDEATQTSLDDRSATVQVVSAETVRCTFTNAATDPGQIIVKQSTNPVGPQEFGFEAGALGSFSLSHGEQRAIPVAPATYDVTQDTSASHVLTSLDCDDDNSTIALHDRRASVAVGPGETVTCTYLNERGSLTLRAETSPPAPGSPVRFTFTGPSLNQLKLAPGEGHRLELGPGEFNFREQLAPGYRLSEIDCDDANSSGDAEEQAVTARITAGEHVTCTFLNVPGDAPSVEPVPVVGADVTYTDDADFDRGTLVNVDHDAPNDDQLQLSRAGTSFPLVWIATTGRGSITKIDTRSGEILGEFATAPSGQPKNPSRTTVVLDGSVWATNRDGNSVVHVGLKELGQCVDRNGNGSIDTSSGWDDVLEWSNAEAADTEGGVTTAADECIRHYVRVHTGGTRHISVTPDDDVWVSGTGGQSLWDLIDGATGEIVRTEGPFACGGYGGLMDGEGVIWSSSGLLRWDPDAPESATNPQCLSVSAYGLALAPDGNVWTSSGPSTHEVAPDGTLLGSFSHGASNAQGLAVDARGHVWVSSALGGGTTVGHLLGDGTHVGNVTDVGTGSTGVAVDAAGKVWTANLDSSDATRIDPGKGPLGADGTTRVGAVDLTVPLPGSSPYNYSDMTGSVALASTSQGSWTVVQDGGEAGTEWASIEWNAGVERAAREALRVEARASDARAGLGAQLWTPVENGEPLPHGGRFIQLRVTFDGADDAAPVLTDLRICGGDACVEPEPTPTPTPNPIPTATPTPGGGPAGAPPSSPAVLPGPAQGVTRASDVVTLPSARKCVSRRRFRIRLRRARGVKLVSATVHVNGKRVKVVRGRRLTSTVDLRSLPKGRFKVRITVVTSTGKKLSQTRRYRTCVPKKRPRRA